MSEMKRTAVCSEFAFETCQTKTSDWLYFSKVITRGTNELYNTRSTYFNMAKILLLCRKYTNMCMSLKPDGIIHELESKKLQIKADNVEAVG